MRKYLLDRRWNLAFRRKVFGKLRWLKWPVLIRKEVWAIEDISGNRREFRYECWKPIFSTDFLDAILFWSFCSEDRRTGRITEGRSSSGTASGG